jgi:hypothetical protein
MALLDMQLRFDRFDWLAFLNADVSGVPGVWNLDDPIHRRVGHEQGGARLVEFVSVRT